MKNMPAKHYFFFFPPTMSVVRLLFFRHCSTAALAMSDGLETSSPSVSSTSLR